MSRSNDSVWGKNPALQRFWEELASGKSVVLMHKDGSYTNHKMPKRWSKRYYTLLTEFENDPTITAVLTSNMSQDAYEQYLYPKAKQNTVAYVLQHYKRFFKTISETKLRVPL